MENDNYLRSIKEIAEFIGCSIPTAQRIKNALPKSIVHQLARKFLIDKQDLLNAMIRKEDCISSSERGIES